MKMVFVPQHLNLNLKVHSLREQHADILFNVHYLSFEKWIQSQRAQESPLLTKLLFHKHLQALSPSFPLYGPLFQYAHFSTEIIQFTKECFLYNIDFNSLPATTKHEQELKEIIQYCAQENHSEKKSISFEFLDFRESETLFPIHSSIDAHQLYLKAVDKGLKTKTWKETSKIHYRSALNPRYEIEGIAQEILRDHLLASDVNLVVCDDSYYDLIHSVFSHYKIPHSFANKTKVSSFVSQFIAGIELAIKKDQVSLMKSLNEEVFNLPLPPKARSYIQRCLSHPQQWMTFTPQYTPLEESSLVSSYDLQALKKMEQEFIAFHKAVIDPLKTLLEIQDPKELLRFVFDRCATKASKENKNKELRFLKNQLDEVFESIESLEDCLTLCEFLNKNQSQTTLHPDSLHIADLKSPLLPRKRVYVVGAHQKNYPNFSARSGLFDEQYVSKIHYPSLQERFDLHCQQSQWIFSAGETCFFSFPRMNYQGKGIEAAIELEALVSSIEELPCLLANPTSYPTQTLMPSLASNLFFKENLLYGSVSSFERYFNCPYAYFLERGLNLKASPSNSIENNLLGTLQHTLLETIYKENLLHQETLKSFLEEKIREQMKELEFLYPKAKLEISLMQDRLLVSLQQMLIFLETLDKEDPMRPSKFEHRFEKKLDHHPITLRGVIDRVDTYGDFFRIVDYKSSSKSLEEKKVKAGVQLQLLTYVLLAKEEFNLQAEGAYYFSLKQENLKMNPIGLKRGKLTEENYPVLSNEEFIKQQRLAGWSFEPSHPNKTYVKGATYSLDAIETVLNELFHLLVTHLKNGKIPLDPNEGACTYCDFKSICRFKGSGKTPTPLVCEELVLKKGSTVDEMES